MTIFYVLSIVNSIVNVYAAYGPAHRRLVAYQRGEGREDEELIDSSENDRNLLEEVVISPSPSPRGSLYQMHGALGAEPESQPTPPERTLTPEAIEDAGDGGYTATAESEGPDDHTSELAFADWQRERVGRRQTVPERQDTASSTGTSAMEATSDAEILNRKVVTK